MWRFDSKKNLLIMGGPGSGKTTIAKRLASDFCISYLDYDTLVQPFLIGIENEFGLGKSRLDFYKKWRQESYGTLIAVIKENIILGCPLIVSAPFTSEMRDPYFFSSLRSAGTPKCTVISFHMAPDDETHLQMLMKRASYRDQEILADWQKYLTEHEPAEPIWDADMKYEIVFSNEEQAYASVLSAVTEYRKTGGILWH